MSLRVTLTTGQIVLVDEDERAFFNGQERGVWFDAETDEHHPDDRARLKINSALAVSVRSASNQESSQA